MAQVMVGRNSPVRPRSAQVARAKNSGVSVGVGVGGGGIIGSVDDGSCWCCCAWSD